MEPAVILGFIAGASLLLNLYQAKLNRDRARRENERAQREGRAELTGTMQSYENAKAPAGWQLRMEMQNIGASTAYDPILWIADSDGAPLTHRYGDHGSLAPGEAGKLSADLPAPPGAGHHGWIGWRDTSGQQERDIGQI